MSRRPMLLLGATMLLAAAPAAIAGERLEFRPEPGTKVDKRWQNTHRLVLVDLTLVRDELEQSAMEEIEIVTTRRMDVVDEYRRIADGRPLELRRLFERVRLRGDLTLNRSGTPFGDTLFAAGTVMGASVVFTWQPELGDYGRYYDREDPGESYLAELVEETDLRSFLPGREVVAGDEWTLPVLAGRQLLSPGGNLEMRFEQTPHIQLARSMLMGAGGGLWHAFSGEPEGKVHARYLGTRELEGVRLGVIELSLEIDSVVDQTALANRLLNVIELLQEARVEEARLEYRARLSGELAWNLEAGLPHSLLLKGEESVRSYRRISPPQGIFPEEQRPPRVMDVRMRGLVEVEMSIARLP